MIAARFWLVTTALLVIPALAVGQTDTDESAPAEAAGITTVEGNQLQMDIARIADGRLSGEDGELELDRIMMIETGRRPVSDMLPVAVYLTGGGMIQATEISLDDEKFRIVSGWGPILLATDSVSGVLLDRTADRARFELAMSQRSVEQDLIIVSVPEGQQSVSGLLESLDSERLMLNYQGESRPINLPRIVGIVTADLKPEMPDGPACRTSTVNGSSVTGALIGLEDGTLELQLPAGDVLPIPWNQVANLSISSDSVVWLSDLEPSAVELVPLATLPFDWKRDLSADGNPITLMWPSTGETRVFSRGIGTRSASRLEFENSADFRKLVATVGIDAETQGNGDCEVSIWADGIQLWNATITGRTDPVSVNLDITGSSRITLVVRHGKFLDLADHVDWAEIRFLKDPE